MSRVQAKNPLDKGGNEGGLTMSLQGRPVILSANEGSGAGDRPTSTNLVIDDWLLNIKLC
ncbi:MAG: hypothetical protein BWY14_00844 [Parcubacteria group bacterium ADurb.Bin192]|mgnify:CR=1 FL=1|nr:MAG: hypothetical protein BWY14_00844 [Parcubacteria group bacterium ADurb.Bin192]